MILKFAWENILRNKKRSFLNALSVFAGALLVGFAWGWINGMLDFMVNGYIKYQTGHIRITNSAYLEREKFMPVDEVITNATALEKKINKLKHVENVSEQIRFGILLGNKSNTVQALGMGVDLEDSPYRIAKFLQSGSLHKEGLYMGSDLARKLNIKQGDEILLATQTYEGGLNGIKLKVAGIFTMSVAELDRRTFFIDHATAKRLLKIPEGAATEIFIYLDENKNTEAVLQEVQKLLPEQTVAEDYKTQMGEMYDMIQMERTVDFFLELIILFLASIVIVNTMMMAIFERIREIGTLKALGFTEKDLFQMFTAEGTIIGILGGIPGALLGISIVFVLSHTGMNLESMVKDSGMPFEYILYPTVGIIDIVVVLALAIVAPVIASMIPARSIRKYTAAQALRM